MFESSYRSREYDSIYISTFGSLNAMLNFRSKSMTPGAQMVQIVEDNLPVIDKIDLRTSGIRSEQYILDHPQYPNALINKFNNYAKKFEEVLLDFLPIDPAANFLLVLKAYTTCLSLLT
jgi:hypothetical protein